MKQQDAQAVLRSASHPHRWAMIMAGGSGTRLWPLSRAARPKQLIPVACPDGKSRSLLQQAAERLDGVVARERQLVCAAGEHEALIREALGRLAPGNYLGEPQGRDTLAAIGFTATVLAARDEGAVLAALASDHTIDPQREFARALDLGFQLVEADPARLVTFSIKATHAATNYGYLQLAQPIEGFKGAVRVGKFVEKPDAARAEQYLADPAFAWNSGMFVFQARTLLQLIARYHPQMASGLARIGEAWGSPRQDKVLREVYPSLTRISIDFGLMEPASHDGAASICAVPMDVEWHDLGSWPAFARTLPADPDGNRANTQAVQLDSARTMLVSDDPMHLIATVGVEDLVIVHTQGATLVCRQGDAERVKEVAAMVRPDLR